MDLLSSGPYRASLERLCAGMDLGFLGSKTVLVTGASGMLGSCLVDTLCVWNGDQDAPCRIIAAGRNLETARRRFASVWEEGFFSFQAWDVCDKPSGLLEQVDYIIHAASNADPVSMANCPVDTLLANVLGTKNLLEYGMSHGMGRFLYVSSGEVYGQPDASKDDFIEGYCGPLDLSNPRSCYPEGKRAAEVLCQGYISQYGVDAVIVRPCHLFGPTMTARDSRAASEFLRKAAAGEDIEMKSAGTLERSHCYVVDAAGALLLVLKDGMRGEAYNIADRRYQMTVREFAERAAEAGGCRVTYAQPSVAEARGYSKSSRMVLDAGKLGGLGWKSERREANAIRETVCILKQVNMR